MKRVASQDVYYGDDGNGKADEEDEKLDSKCRYLVECIHLITNLLILNNKFVRYDILECLG